MTAADATRRGLPQRDDHQLTGDVMQAAAALADALEAESDALRSLDIPRALTLFPRKAEQARLLRIAVPALRAVPPERQAAARALAARLQFLAAENKRLLERALLVQGRVISILARAVPPSQVGYRPAARAAGGPGAAPGSGTGTGPGIAPVTLSSCA